MALFSAKWFFRSSPFFWHNSMLLTLFSPNLACDFLRRPYDQVLLPVTDCGRRWVDTGIKGVTADIITAFTLSPFFIPIIKIVFHACRRVRNPRKVSSHRLSCIIFFQVPRFWGWDGLCWVEIGHYLETSRGTQVQKYPISRSPKTASAI